MFDDSLDKIKHIAFLQLEIVCLISVFVFHTVEKDRYCYGGGKYKELLRTEIYTVFALINVHALISVHPHFYDMLRI